MTHAIVSTTSNFPPFTHHSGATNAAVSFAGKLADIIRQEPSLLSHPERLAEALELNRHSEQPRLQVVESGMASLDGFGTSVLVVVVGRDEDRVPSEEAIRQHFGLTRRESAVAWCLAHRQSNDEIARALSVSPHTARHHTERVLGKLKVHSRRAVRDVLLAPPELQEFPEEQALSDS